MPERPRGPWIPPEDQARWQGLARDVLGSGQLILGPQTAAFEDEFSMTFEMPFAVAVASGSAALEIILRFLEVQGRYVLVPTNTFAATVRAVVAAGGLPVLCDIEDDEDSWGMDQMAVLRALERSSVMLRPAAVILVHLAGLMPDYILPLVLACQQAGVPVIEDAAHAHAARLGSHRAGTLGAAGAFSFYPTKMMTTGAGGMILTRSKELREFARRMRNHGGAVGVRELELAGSNWAMTELGAALGRLQLVRLEDNWERRAAVVTRYRARLGDVLDSAPPPTDTGRHGYYKFPMRARDAGHRDRLLAALHAAGWEAGALYDPPVHRQPGYRQIFGGQGPFPVADARLPRQICLPLHPAMTAADVDEVVALVREASR